jgi:hypothetical protein
MILVVAYSGISTQSRVIKRFTFAGNKGASHVSVVNTDTMKELEAWHKGGVLPPHEIHSLHTPGTPVNLYKINATVEQQEELWKNFLNLVGSKYDWKGIFGLLRRRDSHDKNKVFCSEALDESAKRASLVTLNMPSFKITPMLTEAIPLYQLIAGYRVGMDVRQILEDLRMYHSTVDNPVLASEASGVSGVFDGLREAH